MNEVLNPLDYRPQFKESTKQLGQTSMQNRGTLLLKEKVFNEVSKYSI